MCQCLKLHQVCKHINKYILGGDEMGTKDVSGNHFLIEIHCSVQALCTHIKFFCQCYYTVSSFPQIMQYHYSISYYYNRFVLDITKL